MHYFISMLLSLGLSFINSIIVWEIISRSLDWTDRKAVLRIEYLSAIPPLFALPDTGIGHFIYFTLAISFIIAAVIISRDTFISAQDDLPEVTAVALKEFRVANSAQKAPIYALFFGYAVFDILLSFHIGILAIPLVFIIFDWGILFGYKVFSGENKFTDDFRLIRNGKAASHFKTAFILFFSLLSTKTMKAIATVMRGRSPTREDNAAISAWRQR